MILGFHSVVDEIQSPCTMQLFISRHFLFLDYSKDGRSKILQNGGNYQSTRLLVPENFDFLVVISHLLYTIRANLKFSAGKRLQIPKRSSFL
jgi:hypothetical protein